MTAPTRWRCATWAELTVDELYRILAVRQAVFVVNAVHPGDPAKLEPEQRSALRSQLEQIQGMGSAEEYVRAMRKRYKVQVEESQL